ncbi:4a-hydroxytetrahydrobiopterin dehydratase [Saccharomonospora piscinae]|uniref:4a-hydroxytetrahydrobiopterin dehydratase n=1 Tax=Saccharomonospora piscinae TaxID=687388 RepID=UPI00110619B3|nr:4a-hydroxytetrahydrobiopterin dehydratase [Saccharomonospora piscinae]TLW91877.1 4a-hydroxytetrahydrobiopterin dehydratase [Saccharomonospora piscinae]
MTELLTDRDIDEALRELTGWHRVDEAIERSVTLPSFPDAIRAVDRVAELAEAANHHPDIDIRWRTVTFRLTTHSHGGITGKDVSLAGEIDATVSGV